MRQVFFTVLFLIAAMGWGQAPGPGQMGRGRTGGPAAVAAPEPVDPKKLCKIEGRTLSAVTGEPVPRAGVTLMGSGQNAAARSARSDNNGSFLLENVPPGTYRLTAERVGFLRQGYGARTPGGASNPLTLADAQVLKGVEFRLTPQGVITGQVFDDEGDPLPRASVTAYRAGTLGAVQQEGRGGQPFRQATGGAAMTNDIGEYRIAGLSPGRYIIVASSQGGRGPFQGATQSGAQDQALAPTYYPSVTDPSAALPVDITAGQELGGITIGLKRGLLYRVQGRVMGGSAQDLAGLNVTLIARGAASMMMGRSGSGVRPDGTFEMNRVRPGSYYVVAQRMGRQGTGGLYGKTMMDVTSSDITGLLVPVAEPLAVSGVVKMEAEQKAELPRLTLSLIPADSLPGGTPSGRAAATGAFTIAAVPPDKYFLNVNGLPEGAYVKSVRLGNQEVIDQGIDLTGARGSATFDVILSAKGATVEGVVTAGDKPAPGSTVAILADPLRPGQPYLNKFTTADQDGNFSFRGVAPGSYKVYAWEEPLPELMQDPSLAQPFEAKAVKVTPGEGASERVELKALKPEDARQ